MLKTMGEVDDVEPILIRKRLAAGSRPSPSPPGLAGQALGSQPLATRWSDAAAM